MGGYQLFLFQRWSQIWNKIWSRSETYSVFPLMVFQQEVESFKWFCQEVCWSGFYPDLAPAHCMFHHVDAPLLRRVYCVFHYNYLFLTFAVHRFLLYLQRRMVSIHRRFISCVESFTLFIDESRKTSFGNEFDSARVNL